MSFERNQKEDHRYMTQNLTGVKITRPNLEKKSSQLYCNCLEWSTENRSVVGVVIIQYSTIIVTLIEHSASLKVIQ